MHPKQNDENHRDRKLKKARSKKEITYEGEFLYLSIFTKVNHLGSKTAVGYSEKAMKLTIHQECSARYSYLKE